VESGEAPYGNRFSKGFRMMVGGGISPAWQLALGVGFGAFLTFLLYAILFQPAPFLKSGSGSLQTHGSAWWNHKVVLWTFFLLFVVTEVPLVAGSALSLLFGGVRPLRSPFHFALGLAFDSPFLSVVFLAAHASISSFLILLLLLVTMTRSAKGAWVARHFTQAFLVITVFLLTLQGLGVFLLLNRSTGG